MIKNIPHVVVDVETNGSIISKHSMINLGAVIVEPELNRTFYAEFKPISDFFDDEAISISGFTFEETKKFPYPEIGMQSFENWLKENIEGRPIFWSDNNGYDFSWVNWYFLMYNGKNPFGHSSRRIGDLASGLNLDLHFPWKRIRKKSGIKHDHNPLNDAKGNAFALLELLRKIKKK